MDEQGSEEKQSKRKGRKPRKYGSGYSFETTIESLAFGAAGVGRLDNGKVAFVSGAVPGDRVLASVTRKKKSHIEARTVEVIEASPDRIEPRCEHFGMCGGCRLQNYPYELQLKAKRQQFVDHLERIAGLPNPPVQDIIGMEVPWEYRNKMEYTFSRFSEGELKLGLHRPGFFDRIVNIDHCYLQDEKSNNLRNGVRDFCRERNLSPHNVRKHEGLLRNLVIRTAASGTMACIVTHTKEFGDYLDEFTSYIKEAHPCVTSLHWFVNDLLSGVAIAGEEKLLFGDGFITEKVCGYKMKISPASFVQTNTSQSERLYGVLREYAGAENEGTIYDLYTGMAPIAMQLSGSAEKVIGIEINPMAVADGHKNLADNGISNVELIEGEVEKVIPDLCRSQPPDIVVADPPRAGIHRKAIEAIVSVKPRRMIYVSCNPSTLARDAALLIEAGYTLSAATPVDMFPHTAHIECVARFDL